MQTYKYNKPYAQYKIQKGAYSVGYVLWWYSDYIHVRLIDSTQNFKVKMSAIATSVFWFVFDSEYLFYSPSSSRLSLMSIELAE